MSRRDYQDNIQATDRAYFALSSQHPSVEWPANPAVVGVVYVRGSDVDVVVRWSNANGFGFTGSLTWQAARIAAPTQEGGTEYLDLTVANTSPQTVNLGANNYQDFTLSLTDVPNYVAVGQIQVKFELLLTYEGVTKNHGTLGYFHNWDRLYLVDSAPVDLQEVPWTDFLEYTCRWAFGAAGASEVRRELTRGMHYSNRSPNNRVIYNGGQVANYFDPVNASYSYMLTDMVSSLSTSQWTYMDCQDFAGGLWLAFESHGIEPRFDLVERWNGSSVPGAFYTWPMCRAGFDSTDAGDFGQTDLGNYESFGFSFHCVIAEDGERFDASCSYLWNPTHTTWMNPVWEWGVSPHWQNWSDSEYRGLAYDTSEANYPFTSSSSLAWHIVLGLDPASIL
jgi:hypothetical protein